MKTTTMKTAELSGAALDWAVAVAIGKNPVLWDVCCGNTVGTPDECCLDPFVTVEVDMKRWEPSADWSQGGPLLEPQHIEHIEQMRDGRWCADTAKNDDYRFSDALLIAACRAIVAGKLGGTADVPADLVEVNP